MRLDWLLCFWIFSSCILATWTSWGHGVIGDRLFNEQSYCKMQSRRPSEIGWRLQCYLDDASVKNESGTVRPQEHTSKNNCFLFEMCLLAGIYMHKNPHICTSLQNLCLTKRLLAYHLHLFPIKFPKNATKLSLQKWDLESFTWNIWKTFGETCLGRPDESPANNFTKGSKWKNWKSRFWIHVEPSLTKNKVCVFTRNVQVWATRKVPLSNHWRINCNHYRTHIHVSNATWATKLFSRGQGDASFKSERNCFQSPEMARKKHLALSSCPKLVEFRCKKAVNSQLETRVCQTQQTLDL